MWLHLTDKATGETQTVASLAGYEEDLFDIVELEREPAEFEDIDGGALVPNPKREADAEAGEQHIAEARAQKRIEAVLISSGVALPTGLIAAEATRREIAPAELAAIVLVEAAEFMAAELARQAPDIAAKKLAPPEPKTVEMGG